MSSFKKWFEDKNNQKKLADFLTKDQRNFSGIYLNWRQEEEFGRVFFSVHDDSDPNNPNDPRRIIIDDFIRDFPVWLKEQKAVNDDIFINYFSENFMQVDKVRYIEVEVLKSDTNMFSKTAQIYFGKY